MLSVSKNTKIKLRAKVILVWDFMGNGGYMRWTYGLIGL